MIGEIDYDLDCDILCDMRILNKKEIRYCNGIFESKNGLSEYNVEILKAWLRDIKDLKYSIEYLAKERRKEMRQKNWMTVKDALSYVIRKVESKIWGYYD